MQWIGGLIAGGLGLLGSRKQTQAATQAAQTSADSQLEAAAVAAASQLEAARIAADAARFRPVGVTTRFGTSNFQFDPSGRLTGAGYNVSPELAAIQNRLLSQAGTQGVGATEQALAAQRGLFNLGQQYLAASPEAAAQSWMQRQQAALAPSRERALNQVQQSLFNRGRSGLAVGQGAGMQAANPEMAAYYNALAQQDLDLAAQAQQQGRAQTEFGAGLFGTGAQVAQAGYSPLQTQLGLGQTIEQLGQGALDIGAQLGGRSATAGANVGQSLLQGGSSAAQSMLTSGVNAARTLQAPQSVSTTGNFLADLAGNRQFTSGLGNWLSGFGTPQVDTGVVGYTGSGRGNWF
jgi:hypothetical protein